MEEQGYYTLVEEYAQQAGVQIRFVNAVLTDVVNGDKDIARLSLYGYSDKGKRW